MSAAVADRWDSSLPRKAVSGHTGRRVQCVCDESGCCLFHAAQRDAEMRAYDDYKAIEQADWEVDGGAGE